MYHYIGIYRQYLTTSLQIIVRIIITNVNSTSLLWHDISLSAMDNLRGGILSQVGVACGYPNSLKPSRNQKDVTKKTNKIKLNVYLRLEQVRSVEMKF